MSVGPCDEDLRRDLQRSGTQEEHTAELNPRYRILAVPSEKRLSPTSREYRRYEIYWNLIVAYSCGIVTFPLHNNQGPTPGSIFVFFRLFLQEQASASSREAGVKAKTVARGQCRALPGNPESVVDSYPWVVWGSYHCHDSRMAHWRCNFPEFQKPILLSTVNKNLATSPSETVKLLRSSTSQFPS